MNKSIFHVAASGALTELRRTSYDSEDDFQTLLARYPDLLRAVAGEGGQLLLIRREQPVPDAEQGSGRWSLDHLFLDREGVPVLVEVKQAKDTRARREVVAQMLDYAANGVAFWPIDHIVAGLNDTAVQNGIPSEKLLADFIGSIEPDSYWRQVEANLRSGRIRLVFVSDQIPTELERIVEFLNEQMRPAEVLAIEVEHFASQAGERMLVPRLLGATERAKTAKAVSTPQRPQMSESEWLDELEGKFGRTSRSAAERLIGELRADHMKVGLTDSQDALSAGIDGANGKRYWPIFMRGSTGRIEIALMYLANTRAFHSEEARAELLARIKSLPASSLRANDKLTGWPSVALEELQDNGLWAALRSIINDIQSRITSESHT